MKEKKVIVHPAIEHKLTQACAHEQRLQSTLLAGMLSLSRGDALTSL